ncbi:nucleolar complex protein 3 homolog [Haliotis cracherodii]|uniref:nucleolar complex protein 3 homolog n=1 Tax=Haliotis cracherodii TaxID=6455 RepID=UPI0039EBE67D
MASKKKGKGGKTSSSKIANKKNNKLLKQGKVKKQKQLQIRKQRKGVREAAARGHINEKKEKVTDQEVEGEQNGELHKSDFKFFLSKGRDLSFANLPKQLKNEPRSRKRKPTSGEDDDLSRYEEVPRKLVNHDKNANMKMLLPIKGDSGKVITRMVEEIDEDEEGEHAEDMQDPEAVEEKPLRPLSNVELLVMRSRKLQERKQTIALLATSILENPQENIRRVRELRLMLNEKEPDLYITVRKLVMVSLMEVFKDIVPGYKIRLLTDKEKAQQLKKETRSLHEYECALLLNYKEYLEHLEMSIKGKMPNSKKQPVMEIPKDVSRSVSELACRCMCELLVHHPHFNYSSNIIAVLMPLMRRGAVLRDQVISTVTKVFREDKAGQVTLEIVRSIGRMVKACNYSVKPKVLDTLLALKIREVDLSTFGENQKVERRKEQLQRLSKKEKKRKKAMDKINQELQEVQATEDKKKKLKLHTEIIHAVFVTYFRILKNATQSVLLPSVLEGLARFAHLINIEFFDDLFKVFQSLITSGDLTYRESLHCVQTAFTILTGQGSALNIDPMTFYKQLYQMLFKVHAGRSSDDVPIILDCLDLMISRRRKQVSQQRILSYMKRLSTLTLQQMPHSVLGLLSTIRGLIQGFPCTDRLFDNEAEGSGVFRPDIEDPEHCNAQNSVVWELTLLQHHFHPVVRQYTAHISRMAPSTGEGQLAPNLARVAPKDLYRRYDLTQHILDTSIPAQVKTKKKKFQTSGFHSEELQSYMEKQCAAVPNLPGEDMMDIG